MVMPVPSGFGTHTHAGVGAQGAGLPRVGGGDGGGRAAPHGGRVGAGLRPRHSAAGAEPEAVS